MLTVGKLSLEFQNLGDLQIASPLLVYVLEYLVELIYEDLLICVCHVGVQISEEKVSNS